MTRASSRQGHAIRCDHRPHGDYTGPGYCAAIYRSSAPLRVLGEQLAIAGWTIVGGREPHHLCPAHKPGPRPAPMPDQRNALDD